MWDYVFILPSNYFGIYTIPQKNAVSFYISCRMTKKKNDKDDYDYD